MDGSLFVRVNMGFLDRRLSSRARARASTHARAETIVARASFDEASKRVDERRDGARARARDGAAAAGRARRARGGERARDGARDVGRVTFRRTERRD